MLDAELADERQNEILTRARELVERGGGSWVSQEAWGRRKLAYEIDKKTEAHYHLLHFDCEPETLEELTRVLKITDGVLRHRIIKLRPGTPDPPDLRPSAQPAAEAAEAAEPAEA